MQYQLDPISYYMNNVIQWNLAIPATLGTSKSGWISDSVAGNFLMYVEDETLNQSMPELLAAIASSR